MKTPTFWTCVIGPTDRSNLPDGADFPLRIAVREAFSKITGHADEICNSGWGAGSKEAAESEKNRSLVYVVQKSDAAEPELRKLTAGELLRLITNFAKDYHANAPKSVLANHHMNDLKPSSKLDVKVTDAVLVDFINYIGGRYCVDYALYTQNLTDKKMSVNFAI